MADIDTSLRRLNGAIIYSGGVGDDYLLAFPLSGCKSTKLNPCYLRKPRTCIVPPFPDSNFVPNGDLIVSQYTPEGQTPVIAGVVGAYVPEACDGGCLHRADGTCSIISNFEANKDVPLLFEPNSQVEP